MKSVPAPVYVDTFDLCQWLLNHFGRVDEALPRRLCEESLGLLRAVTLALRGRRRDEHLDAADERLIALRAEIRLAQACGYLQDSQMLHALSRADAIGRQLGGWMKSREAG